MTFETFAALVALDPERRERFLNDPRAELQAVGLNLSPKGVKALENLAKVIEEGDFPVDPPVDDPHGGG